MSDAEHLGLTTIQLTSTLGKRIDRLKAELDFQIKDNWKLTTELMVFQNENDRLRKLCASLYGYAHDENPEGTELNFADDMRELGIEVGV